jgi:hypothetical protein
MQVSFIGSPCSGKTTTAAMVFAALKEIGISCEFIVEEARRYIAQKRFNAIQSLQEPFKLDDEDQLNIMDNQIHIENMYRTVCHSSTIIVCDSSPFNSLLYMSPDGRNNAITRKLVEKSIFNSNLVFYAPPVLETDIVDTNRVHDPQASLLIDQSIPKIMLETAPAVWKTVIPLTGDPKARLGQVTSAIMLRRF